MGASQVIDVVVREVAQGPLVGDGRLGTVAALGEERQLPVGIHQPRLAVRLHYTDTANGNITVTVLVIIKLTKNPVPLRFL